MAGRRARPRGGVDRHLILLRPWSLSRDAGLARIAEKQEGGAMEDKETEGARASAQTRKPPARRKRQSAAEAVTAGADLGVPANDDAAAPGPTKAPRPRTGRAPPGASGAEASPSAEAAAASPSGDGSAEEAVEALARETYERIVRDDTFDDLKRRAAFNAHDKGLLLHWLSVARATLAKSA